jgi:NTE family protein
MLFHLGTLWRLNEAGVLPTLERISSVSGGSITAGMLGLAWDRLGFEGRGVATRFEELVVAPVRGLASHTVDVESVIIGVLSPGAVNERVQEAYGRHLFGDATLQDLPEHPRFVLNATNLQSGALVRFSRPYAADYLVGTIDGPRIPLAEAVGASSAFPPFLSPCVIKVAAGAFRTVAGNVLTGDGYRRRLVLSDGGVYDNLGLETAWKRYRTILVSDGGGHMGPDEDPPRVWPLQMLRVLKVVDNQVRDLRKRQVIGSYNAGTRDGAYWSIRSDLADFPLSDPLACPVAETRALAAIATRLAALPEITQERLINWGYAAADAGLRAHVDLKASPGAFPYPAAGVG